MLVIPSTVEHYVQICLEEANAQIKQSIMYDGTEFAHQGVKGTKWGVRKWQNKDGSYTPAGLADKPGGRYNQHSGEGTPWGEGKQDWSGHKSRRGDFKDKGKYYAELTKPQEDKAKKIITTAVATAVIGSTIAVGAKVASDKLDKAFGSKGVARRFIEATPQATVNWVKGGSVGQTLSLLQTDISERVATAVGWTRRSSIVNPVFTPGDITDPRNLYQMGPITTGTPIYRMSQFDPTSMESLKRKSYVTLSKQDAEFYGAYGAGLAKPEKEGDTVFNWQLEASRNLYIADPSTVIRDVITSYTDNTSIMGRIVRLAFGDNSIGEKGVRGDAYSQPVPFGRPGKGNTENLRENGDRLRTGILGRLFSEVAGQAEGDALYYLRGMMNGTTYEGWDEERGNYTWKMTPTQWIKQYVIPAEWGGTGETDTPQEWFKRVILGHPSDEDETNEFYDYSGGTTLGTKASKWTRWACRYLLGGQAAVQKRWVANQDAIVAAYAAAGYDGMADLTDYFGGMAEMPIILFGAESEDESPYTVTSKTTEGVTQDEADGIIQVGLRAASHFRSAWDRQRSYAMSRLNKIWDNSGYGTITEGSQGQYEYYDSKGKMTGRYRPTTAQVKEYGITDDDMTDFMGVVNAARKEVLGKTPSKSDFEGRARARDAADSYAIPTISDLIIYKQMPKGEFKSFADFWAANDYTSLGDSRRTWGSYRGSENSVFWDDFSEALGSDEEEVIQAITKQSGPIYKILKTVGVKDPVTWMHKYLAVPYLYETKGGGYHIEDWYDIQGLPTKQYDRMTTTWYRGDEATVPKQIGELAATSYDLQDLQRKIAKRTPNLTEEGGKNMWKWGDGDELESAGGDHMYRFRTSAMPSADKQTRYKNASRARKSIDLAFKKILNYTYTGKFQPTTAETFMMKQIGATTFYSLAGGYKCTEKIYKSLRQQALDYLAEYSDSEYDIHELMGLMYKWGKG